MRYLFSLSFLLFISTNSTNAQCITPSSFNGSLDFGSTITSIPNDMAPTGWSKLNTPDQAVTGVQTDCASIPLTASSDGGSWVRMADKVTAQEGIQRTISGFTSGTYYDVSFKQSLLKNWGRSSGNVKVTLGTTSIYSTTISLPVSSSVQTGWQSVTVGPFLATASSMTLSLEAHSNLDGTGVSAMPSPCGYTQNAQAADLMIDGVTICVNTTLPLHFVSLELKNQSLSWNVVDSDNELDKFIVAESSDLLDWHTIATVQGKDNIRDYSVPVELRQKTCYYKIISYDRSNTVIASSKIISGKSDYDEAVPCGWYDKGLEELIISESGGKLMVMIIDTQGSKLYENYFANTSVSSIPISSFREGMYVVFVNNSVQSCSFKFIR